MMEEIVYIIYILGLSPFIAIGMFKVFSALVDVIRVRLGQIKIFQKLPNDRVISFWKKPTGDKIKFKDKEVVCRIEKDWAYFTSSVVPIPTVYYDENDRQIMLKTEKGTVPTDEFEKIYNVAYLAGRTSLFQEDKRMRMFMIIALVAVAVAAGGIIYLNIQFGNVDSAVSALNARIENLQASVAASPPAEIPVLT